MGGACADKPARQTNFDRRHAGFIEKEKSMVAIVGGNGAGLLNGSAGVLGQQGVAGNAILGGNKEGAYVNIVNGNLTLQDSDDFLAAHGVNVALTRTYNAQGNLNDGNGANWKYGLLKQVTLVSGAVNTAGSKVSRLAGDGSVATYTYDAAQAAYLSTDGGGAYQSITFNAASNEWTWRADRHDLLGLAESYDNANGGRIVRVSDAAGVRQSYHYNGAGRLSQVTDAVGPGGLAGASGDQTWFDYDAAGNLSQVRTVLAGGATFVRTHYGYDALNRLHSVTVDLTPDDASIADGQVYTTTYGYDGDSNRIASIAQSDGSSTSFTYRQVGADWKVDSYTDGLGRKSTFDYSVPGRTKVTDPLGLSTVYGYDGQGQLTDISAPAVNGVSQVVHFYYDAKGNVSHVTDARGLDTAYSYDANGNRTLERDAAGNTVARAYDLVSNRLLAEARYLTPDADGAGAGTASVPLTTRYTYDTQGRLHFVFSPEGRLTEYRYHPTGELASELHYGDQLFNMAGWGVLSAPNDGQIATIVAGAGFNKSNVSRTDYTYDGRGLRASATRYANTNANGDGLADGLQSTTRYIYDQAGQLLHSYDGNNNASTVSYDGLGRILAHSDALGNSVVNAYDGANQSVTVKAAGQDGALSVTSYVRDAAGQLRSVSQQYGNQQGSSSNVYDADGRLRMSTSAGGQHTYWLYDEAGRKVAQVEHNGALTEYVYNQDNQLTRTIRYGQAIDPAQLTDAQGQPRAVTLAALRPAASAQRPDRSSWNGYDNAGRLVATVDANGYLTRQLYDGASRLVQTIYRALPVDVSKLDGQNIPAAIAGEASADDRISRTVYDLDGNVTGQLDALGYLTEHRYNPAGQLVETIRYDTATAPAQRPAGALAALRPAASPNDVHQRYFYNGKNQLVGSIDGDNYLTETSYDAAGNVAGRRRYATAVTAPAAATLELVGKRVSADDRLTSYSYTALNQLQRESTLAGTYTEYAYDGLGNVTAVTSGAGSTADRTSLTRYDGVGHVIAELSQEGVARLAALGSNPDSSSVERIWNTYARHYRYTVDGLRSSATDAMGNRTLYYYDAMGRLSHTIDPSGMVQEQHYDSDGLLIRTTQYAKHLGPALLAGLNGGQDDSALASAMLNLANVSLDRSSVFYYDDSGRLSFSVDAAGQVSGQNYTAFGQVAQQIQYNTVITGARLHGLQGGRGQQAWSELAGLTTNDPNSATTRLYYDADGRLSYTVNALGEVSATVYNGMGQLSQTIAYGSRVALSTLSGASGDLPKLAALAGKASHNYQYNHRGQVTDVSDALLNHTLTSYNGFGEVSSRNALATVGSLAASAQDQSLRTLYDQAGRVLATIDGAGAVSLHRYDSAGRLGELIRYARPLAAADAASATAANIATLAAALAAVPAPGNGATDQHQRYCYDAAGRVSATMTLQRNTGLAEWSLVTEQRDANGNLLEHKAYATVLKSNDPTQADVATLASSDTDAITRYSYDKLNRVVGQAVVQYAASNTNAWAVTTIAYDDAGNVSSRTEYANLLYAGAPPDDMAGAVLRDPAVDRTTRYGYDGLNRLRYTIDAAGGVSGLVYDNLGRVSQRTAYATTSQLAAPIPPDFAPATDAADRVSRTVYDVAGRPVYEIDAKGGVKEQRFDAYGNLSATVAYATPLAADTLAGLAPTISATDVKALVKADPADRTQRYVYDLNGRLRYSVDAAGYFKETQYDGLGQIICTLAYQTAKVFADATLAGALTAESSAQAATARVIRYQYDNQGNLLRATDALQASESYSYDALGRKLSYTNKLGSVWTYQLDAAGRMVQERSPQVTVYSDPLASDTLQAGAGQASQLVTELSYDAFGHVHTRTEGAGTAAARTTEYRYDRVGRQTETLLPQVGAYNFNAARDADGRQDTLATPSTKVLYDAFGDAVENHDAAGNVSFKAYDQLGRVGFEIDAMQYVTGYQRDTFGNVTALTRYNLTQNVGGWGGADKLGKLIKLDAANDRTIRTRYDVLGRAVKVTEPLATVYDQHSTGARYLTASRTTDTSYNAYGDVIRQQVYGADAGGNQLTDAASTRFYYDLRGHKSAQINALLDTPAARSGYLSTYSYDAAGNLLVQTDYSAAISAWSDTGYTANTGADKQNRSTQYGYDQNDNRTSESKLGVDYSNAAGATVNGNLTTRYGYDALGRQVSETDALNQVSYTYYDALGRITAVARQQTATTAMLTEFKRDLYGNALLRIDYANAATTANGGSAVAAPTPVGGGDPLNRITATSYDINGRALRVLDAEQYAKGDRSKATFNSYDVFGHLAKQWRTVTNEGSTETAYQLNGYDALGRLIYVQTPGNRDLVDGSVAPDVQKVSQLNAFGEVIGTQLYIPASNTLSQLSTTRYDQAGHAWFSNGGDGVDTVTLYDVQGNATAQIRSTSADVHQLARLGSAAEAIDLDNVLRTDTQYDLLGHAVDSTTSGALASVLQLRDGQWVKSAPGYHQALNDSLIVIGRREDAGKNLQLRYRLKPDGAWVDETATRLQWIDGYPVFSTGGLPGGDYEYKVYMQPAGETWYEASGGLLHVEVQADNGKNQQVAALYLMLLGRAPDAAGMNNWVGHYNQGALLAQIAADIYGSDEARSHLTGDNSAIVRQLFQAIGRPQPSDADYGSQVATWAARLDQAGSRQAAGAVIASLLSLAMPALATRASAVTNYLRQGGSDADVLARLVQHAGTAPDGAIAEGNRAAQLEQQRAQLARLYLTLFSRAPDKGGFEFWAAAMANGSSAAAVAQSMLQGAEANDAALLPAASLTPDQYNDKLVRLAYANLLGRAPTDAELAAAKAKLGGTPPTLAHGAFLVELGQQVADYAGTDGVAKAARSLLFDKTTVCLAYAAMDSLGNDPAQIMQVNKAAIAAIGTADSARAAAHQATLLLQTQAQAALGALDGARLAAHATPLEALRLQLSRLYAVLLNRAPEQSGLQFWMAQLKGGAPGTLAGIAADMLAHEGSNAALYPPILSDSAFLTRLFTLGLGMPQGSATLARALADWTPRLSGTSRAQVALAVIDSVLAGTTGDAATRNLLSNKAAVGVTYAGNLGGSELVQAQTILTLVTDTDIKAAIDYGSNAVLQTAATAAAATAAAARASASQTNTVLADVRLLVTAQGKLTPAQTVANANPLAAPLLRAAQLYVGLLNRSSLDLLGVSNMALAMQGGRSDADLAQSIFDSDEGKRLFPAANYNATQFVTQIYRQALGREPDPAGLAFWVAGATSPASRAHIAADMIQAFLENPVADSAATKVGNLQSQASFHDRVSAALSTLSTAADAAIAAKATATDASNMAAAAAAKAAAVITAANNGASTNARKVLEVSRLFVGILNRGTGPGQTPIEIDGLNFWTRARLEGVSLDDLADNFLRSDEGKRLFANAGTNQAFINQLYQQILGRTPAPGDNFWLNALNSGTSRAKIASGIITSLTEETYQAESEFRTKANFDQRVADVMRVLAANAAGGASAALNDLNAKLKAKNDAAANVTTTRNAMNTANALTVDTDPAVVAAKADADRASAFLASPNIQAITELLVGFSRPADFNTVAALASRLNTTPPDFPSVIKPFLLNTTDRSAMFLDLYSKVLHRQPDPSGLNWWVSNTSSLPMAAAAYEFFKGCLPELYGRIATQRPTFKADFDAVYTPNLNQANALVRAYPAARTAAAARIPQQQTDATKAYNDAVTKASQTDTAWQFASSFYAVARVAGAALTAAGTVQTAAVAADRAMADSLAANAALPALAVSVGLTAGATLADFTALGTRAASVKAAGALDIALVNARAGVERADAVRVDAVQHAVDDNALSHQVTTVTQLYLALLNREPTLVELNVGLGAMKAGKSAADLADALIAANPLAYPQTLSNDAYVTKLYAQIMARTPDAKGLRFWSDTLNGPNGQSRGALALGLARSVALDNTNSDTVTFDQKVATALTSLAAKAQVQATTPNLADFVAANTIALRDEASAFDAAAQAALTPAGQYATEMAQLYLSLLGRDVEPSALTSGVAQRSGGTPLLTIVQSMLDAPETRARFNPAMSDAQFVTAFYTLGLGRPADAAELTAATGQLAGGRTSRAQLVLNLLKDLYAYNGGDAVKAGARTDFMAKVTDSLARSASALGGYAAGLQQAAARSATMEQSGLLDRLVDGAVVGHTSTGSAFGTVDPAHITVDRWGNVLSVADARDANWKISYSYNYNNQQIAQTANALSATPVAPAQPAPTIVTHYDALGRMADTVDARGAVDKLTYDVNGNVLTETHADHGVVTSTYNLFGNRTSVKQPDSTIDGVVRHGTLTSYAYDHLGHLKTLAVQSTDPAALVNVYSDTFYDDAHDSPYLSQRQQLVTSYEYDELGRQISVTDAAGAIARTGYDLDGNVIMTETAHTNHGEHVDKQGDIVHVAAVNRTVSRYDALHHRTALRDANGAVMRWVVDAFGQLSYHQDLGGGVTTYRYDAAGEKLAETTTRDTKNADGSLFMSTSATINYSYEEGRLTRIEQGATNYDGWGGHNVAKDGMVTTYNYDRNGNRLSERQSYGADVTFLPARVQNNTLRYDMQNRLVNVKDDQYDVSYTYDANGNRLSVATSVNGGAINTVYNAYDEMNRQTVVNGDWDAVGKKAVMGKGHVLRYDLSGNRIEDSYVGAKLNVTNGNYYLTNGQLTKESYSYDAVGRLTDTLRDGVRVDSRHYDGAGRVTESGFLNWASSSSMEEAAKALGMQAGTVTYHYDDNGRVQRQTIRNIGGALNSDIYFVKDRWLSGGGYDTVGNLLGYTIVTPKTDRTDYGKHVLTYVGFDGYQESTDTAFTSNKQGKTNGSQYDVFGNRTRISETGEGSGKDLAHYWYDADGHVQLKADYTTSAEHPGGSSNFSLIVNGQVLGYENGDPSNVLGSAYTGVSSPTLTAAPSAYTVQNANETLQSIAQAVWGDSKLWYLIADANGLNAGDKLQVNQVLNIPTRANTVHNDYATFKPYNATEATGTYTPATPPPSHHGGCGIVGQIIMVVVAVAVTYVTAGALSGLAASGLAGAMGAGAIAGAAGSIASQMAGMAMGMQDGFNWKGVATAAVGGALTAGVADLAKAGDLGSVFKGNDWTAVAARAAMSNVASQGVGIMTHQQQGFDWRGVAASAVGAGLGAKMSEQLGMNNPASAAASGFMRVAAATASGFTAGVATSIMKGGRISVTQIATDAFGNALGSSLADAVTRPSLPTSMRNLPQEQQDRMLDMAQKAGLNAFSSDDKYDIIKRAADLRFNPDAQNLSTAQRLSRTNDYLGLLGATDEQISAVNRNYADAGIGDKSHWQNVAQADDTIIAKANTAQATSFLGKKILDDGIIGIGEVVSKFGQFVDNNPIAKYTLEGLDIISGPVMYGVRQIDAVKQFTGAVVGKIADFFADGFANAGRSDIEAQNGGVGGVSALSAGVSGFAGAVKGLGSFTSEFKFHNAGKGTPRYDRWINEMEGTVHSNLDRTVVYTRKDGIAVRYSEAANGKVYPDFAPHLNHPSGVTQVTIEEPFSRSTSNFRAANIEAGHPEWGSKAPEGYTWHHHEDGKTMQLVPEDIHADFLHYGGVSATK